MNKKIFFVGMPGSGKSTIGKHVAMQLGYDFIDLDDVIVSNEGREITEIFKDEGEEYFRNIEHQYLVELIEKKESFILATGGGAPCFFDNMERMNQSGITIFLNVPIEDLYNKLKTKGTDKRPLLKNISASDLLSELKQKFEVRQKFFEQSRIIIPQRLGHVVRRVNQVIAAIQSLEE
jgi:shikimate kinase